MTEAGIQEQPGLCLEQLDLEQFDASLAATPSGKAMGMDGWPPAELKALPRRTEEAMARILAALEGGA